MVLASFRALVLGLWLELCVEVRNEQAAVQNAHAPLLASERLAEADAAEQIPQLSAGASSLALRPPQVHGPSGRSRDPLAHPVPTRTCKRRSTTARCSAMVTVYHSAVESAGRGSRWA